MGQLRRRSDRHQSGSGDSQAGPSEPEFLTVGHITRPHGIRGDLRAQILTDYPDRLMQMETLYIGTEHTPYQIESIRRYKQGLLIRFTDINDRNDAELLRDSYLFIHIDDAVPLQSGEYYLFQIEGINVVTDEGHKLGKLTNFIETGANDVYVITNEAGRELLIPAIPSVIKQVDIERHVMTVHLLEGLIDPE